MFLEYLSRKSLISHAFSLLRTLQHHVPPPLPPHNQTELADEVSETKILTDFFVALDAQREADAIEKARRDAEEAVLAQQRYDRDMVRLWVFAV